MLRSFLHRLEASVFGSLRNVKMASQDVVEKYSTYCAWLRDSKFLRELENDSVDSEVLEEELKALRVNQVPLTARQKVVKMLQSNPVQFVLCVIILLDAGIVIAQILLDINSVKEMLHHQDIQLEVLMRYIKETRSDLLLHKKNGNYDIDDVIRVLDERHDMVDCSSHDDDAAVSTTNTSHPSSRTMTSNRSFQVRHNPVEGNKLERKQHRRRREKLDDRTGWRNADDSGKVGRPRRHRIWQRSGQKADDGQAELLSADSSRWDVSAHEANGQRTNDSQSGSAGPLSARVGDGGGEAPAGDPATDHARNATPKRKCKVEAMPTLHRDKHDVYHEVAHGLHLASIAILGLLVIEDVIKIVAMGKTFCQHKMEIYDAIIIAASFTMDLVFLGGVAGEEGQKAVGILVILLIWRIARVIDGIVMTVKQRQEFRIALQKRARRMAEKKVELHEEEKIAKDKEIEALKELCLKAGLRDEELTACAPKQNRRISRTMCALSSVAQLSISVTMSVPSQIDTDAADTPAAAAAPAAAAGAASVDHEVAPLQKGHRFSFPQCDIGRRSTERRNTVQSQPILMESAGRKGGFHERRSIFDRRPPAPPTPTPPLPAVGFYLAEEESPANGSIVGGDVAVGGGGGSKHLLNSPVNCSGVQIVIDGIVGGDGVSEANLVEDTEEYETTTCSAWLEGCYDANESTSTTAILLVDETDLDHHKV